MTGWSLGGQQSLINPRPFAANSAQAVRTSLVGLWLAGGKRQEQPREGERLGGEGGVVGWKLANKIVASNQPVLGSNRRAELLPLIGSCSARCSFPQLKVHHCIIIVACLLVGLRRAKEVDKLDLDPGNCHILVKWIQITSC